MEAYQALSELDCDVGRSELPHGVVPNAGAGPASSPCHQPLALKREQRKWWCQCKHGVENHTCRDNTTEEQKWVWIDVWPSNKVEIQLKVLNARVTTKWGYLLKSMMTQKVKLWPRANRVKRDGNYTASKCHTAFSLMIVSRRTVYKEMHRDQVEVSNIVKGKQWIINDN